VYLATYSGKVHVIDGSVNKIMTDISLGDDLGGFVVDSTKNMIYVGGTYTNKIYMINDTSIRLAGNIQIRDDVSVQAINPSKNMLYATSANSGKVYKINTQTRSVVTNFTLGEYRNNALAIDPDKNRIYVANSNFPIIHVIDDNTNDIIVNITLSNTPLNIAVDPVLDRVYVTKFSPTFYIINEQTNRQIPNYGYLRSILLGQNGTNLSQSNLSGTLSNRY
jgi:YVTN family beta-propeller protein